MWIIFWLSVVATASAMEIDCDRYRYYFFDICPRPKLFEQIPREVEEFNALCPEISPYLECSKNFLVKCVDKERFSLEVFARKKVFFEELCEEGSSLNEVAKSNLKCFNETFTNTNCDREREAFLKPYETEVPLDEFTTTHVIPEKVHCMSEILFAECIATDIIKNCGSKAGLAAMEYFSRTSYIDANCPLSYRETLLEDLDEFTLTAKQKTFAVAELERMKISDGL